MSDPARVRALLGGPGLAPLFEEVRRRLEETGGEARTVTLRGAPAETRAAVADLMGWGAIPADPLHVALDDLDRALRESAAEVALRSALEYLRGPLRDLRCERQLRGAERARRWEEARAAVDASSRPELVAWIEQLQRGPLARAARAAGRSEQELLADALRVALWLPAGGKLLAVFASEVLGDPHALDPGAALTPLALRAAACLAGWPGPPAGAAARRRLWAEVGVDCDPLSSCVLVYGLRPAGASLLARHLREAAEAGEPRRITLRELQRSELGFEPAAALHVCENPAVVTRAADALGARSSPLVCSEGVPSTAVVQLLQLALAGGAKLLVRADFDWPGLRIAAQLMVLGNGRPWRFSAADYRSALDRGCKGPRLEGAPGEAAWDLDLAPAMSTGGVSIPEEQLIPELLEDLAAAQGAMSTSRGK